MRIAIHVTVALILFSISLAVADENGDQIEIQEYAISDYDREHWSFAPLVRPMLPEVRQESWCRNPIDRFVLAQLEGIGLSPQSEAPAHVLLRRLKYDLIGLPPTIEELDEFLADEQPNDFSRWVDRFLASPGYGERWAQHWLDLARFAETDGFEHDKVRGDAWRYRQWVIDALNSGMSYAQFVEAQLAGDLNKDPSDDIATMFCLAGPDMPDINEQDLRRHDLMNELTSTVGSSLLGLQMHCAQCHDHKYDPISQADFYRLRTIFENSVPELKRDQHVTTLTRLSSPINPFFHGRGELGNLGPRVEPQPPRIVCDTQGLDRFSEGEPRQQFVQWMFADRNPIVARVIANRIWQHHFGKSLTGNPSDLGIVAAEPSHPQLLDWLATELIAHDWDIKHLHRIILNSAVYRQASFPDPSSAAQRQRYQAAFEADPDNEKYGRFPRIRLSGEIVRDSLLAVSGSLDREYGGPSVTPALPDELTSTLLKGQWKVSENPADHVRRSVYIFARRNLRYPIFEVFDRPDAGASCAVRGQSTTAIQSLQMLNSQLTLDAANRLAALYEQQLHTQVDGAYDTTLDKLFRTVLGRSPISIELDRFGEYLRTANDKHAGLTTICVALFNTSEFIYVD